MPTPGENLAELVPNVEWSLEDGYVVVDPDGNRRPVDESTVLAMVEVYRPESFVEIAREMTDLQDRAALEPHDDTESIVLDGLAWTQDVVTQVERVADDLVASGKAADLEEAVAMIRDVVTPEAAPQERGPSAAERRAARGTRDPDGNGSTGRVTRRLREDLFGSAGGVK